MLALLYALTLPAQPLGIESPPEDTQLATVQRTVEELATTIARARENNDDARARLAREEAELSSGSITSTLLEQVRLDAAAAQSQLDNIKGRLESREQALKQLQASIKTLEAQIRDFPPPSDSDAQAQLDALQAELEQKKALQKTLEKLLAALQTLRDESVVQASLASDRLTLLQSRFQLSAAVPDVAPTNPRAEQIQRELDQLLERSTRLRNQAAAVTGDTPDALARKHLLEIQAQDAEERGELKQNQLEMLRIEQRLQTLTELTEAESVPVDALQAARDKMQNIIQGLQTNRQSLDDKQQVLTEQRRIIEQRGAIAEGENRTFDRQLTIMDELLAAVTEQQRRVGVLLETATNNQALLQEVVGKEFRRSLLERRTLPPDAEGWKRLANGLAVLPFRVLNKLTEAAFGVVQRLQETSAQLWAWIIVSLAVLTGAVLWLRWFLKRRIIERRPDSATAVPARTLRRNLLGLILPGAWLILANLLELPRSEVILLLALLLVWPAVKFSLNLAHAVLLENAPHESYKERLHFYRSLRWVLVLVGVLAAILVIAQTVAVTPAVADAIDRFSMLCLLLIALPTLHLRALIMASYRDRVGGARFWVRCLAQLSFVVPLVIAGCALLGIVGYVNLAWSIAEHLGWLVIVGAALLLVLVMLRDSVVWFEQRFRAGYEKADFWIDNFTRPIYRLLSLGLVISAGYILFQIFQWDTRTPVINFVPGILDTAFTIGETTLRLENILLAIVLVSVVFWAGGWSKQVSYHLAYVKIRDLGIRQSLSTFTQYIVVVLGLTIAMKIIGLDLTALTVFAGALGVGIGFGLQNITNNFISGILLLAERPLRASDIVKVDQYEGEVTRIGIRSLTVKTWDSQQVIIPNSSVISQPFTNWTRDDDLMRTVLMIGISYDNDPHKALALIASIVNEHPATVANPAPKVVLWDFADSAVMIRVQYYTHIRGSIGLMDVRSQILLAIWDRFKESGIEIPYPQQDVHVRSIAKDAVATQMPTITSFASEKRR